MMVVAPRHELITMPSLDKPRVISEIKKNKKKFQSNVVAHSKPRISGELEWLVNSVFQIRHVEVRDGSLLVYNTTAGPEIRLPLRHLSLQPASQPRTFSLVRDHQALVTLQAGTDEQYERWVKTLAVELMRQTPLEAIRFLDILGITATIANTRGRYQEGCMRRGVSENNLSSEDDTLMRDDFVCEASDRGRTKERTVRVRVADVHEDRCKRPLRAQSSDPVRKMSDSDSDLENVDDKEVAALIVRCQQVDSYVPVREKRRLFESLCRRGRRLAQSSDNLCTVGVAEVKLRRKKRARSLHDLSRCTKSSVAVREICRYFEQRGQIEEPPAPQHKVVGSERSVGGCNAYLSRRRVQRGERRLAKIKQQTLDCEETIWRLQEEMATLDRRRIANSGASRPQELRLYAALEMRLAEEETRLNRLQDDAARTLREIEVATDKFETALVQSSEELTSKNNGRQ